MDFNEATYGVNPASVYTYIGSIKADVLDTVANKLNDTEEIISALRAGWNGTSETIFEQKLAENIQIIIDDLNKEYVDLKAKMQELANMYIQQDNLMMEDK